MYQGVSMRRVSRRNQHLRTKCICSPILNAEEACAVQVLDHGLGGCSVLGSGICEKLTERPWQALL